MENVEKHVDDDEKVEQLMQHSPRTTTYGNKLELINYEGFWHLAQSNNLKHILTYQRDFVAHDSDLIIASHPKTGTTWLKSLLFAIVNRFHHNIKETPLLFNHPHDLVFRLESHIYGSTSIYPRPHDLPQLPSPRLLSTHFPYTSLPKSINTSSCRILYIGRNPLDTCVSQWHFYSKSLPKVIGQDFHPPPIHDYFEDFYNGKIIYGSFFEHLLGYWNTSLEQPEKVLFLKYEEMKEDTIFHVKRLAEFIGFPFSPEEESQGIIEELIELCSIKNMKELKGNKEGIYFNFHEKKTFFRKGEVGDWTNYFTPSMGEKMIKLMEEKFATSGLSFKMISS